MAIPTYEELMLPLLERIQDGKEHRIRDVINKLSLHFNLSPEERNILQPSGHNRLFDNRAHWARKFLKEAGLLKAEGRGIIRITSRGQQIIKDKPKSLSFEYLKQFPEFRVFISGQKSDIKEKEKVDEDEAYVYRKLTPEEILEEEHIKIKGILARELLEKIKEQTPEFFENLVLDLLLRMGYGGSRRDAGHTTKRTGDEGIDGTIYEDRLGLDIIYIQAKKWDQNIVGRPELQKFVGALHGQKAKKGIYITTSKFSNDAIEYANNIEDKIVLIDGETLANLMIDFEVGISKYKTLEIKKIDSDYFEED